MHVSLLPSLRFYNLASNSMTRWKSVGCQTTRWPTPLLLFAGPLGATVNLFTQKCRRHWSPCGGSQCQSSVSHHKTNWQNVEKRPACCCCKAVGQEDFSLPRPTRPTRSTPTANELSVSARPKKRFLQCQKPCPKAVHRSRRLSVTPMTGNNNNNISSSNNNHRPASYSLTKYWFCPIACPLSLQRPSMTLWLWF